MDGKQIEREKSTERLKLEKPWPMKPVIIKTTCNIVFCFCKLKNKKQFLKKKTDCYFSLYWGYSRSLLFKGKTDIGGIGYCYISADRDNHWRWDF